MKNEIKLKVDEIKNSINELYEDEFYLKYGLFCKNIKQYINDNITKEKKHFEDMCNLYGQNSEDYYFDKGNLLKKYQENFEKILNLYDIEFINVLDFFSEIIYNENVVILNYIKSVEKKERLLKSQDFKDYLMKYIKTKRKYKLAKNSVDKEKYKRLLIKNPNPVLNFDKKIDASLKKYEDYLGLEMIISKALDDISKKTLIDLKINEINENSMILNDNFIVKQINKLFNRIFGSKKFKKEYLLKRKDLIENNQNIIIKKEEEIKVEASNLISKLYNYKKAIDNRFMQSI